jgi:hypothetical protein
VAVIRAQVMRLDEFDMVMPEALDGLLGQRFLGGVVTQAWEEDGWVMIEAIETDVPPCETPRVSLGFDVDNVVSLRQRVERDLPHDPWKPLGVTCQGHPVKIAPVGTLPPGTDPER